ncbi:MAG: hypothetical protein A2Y64_05860 [Candidatus Coatesbacteria bacterium RBG_13_66_14]|uniref:Uncharacterized protein n=1 Tax=Candidatus Coatesbacteria bacterium RBG_13_66_14 TaxID=1817816 RepID=A0A1F5FFI0_9BACT|nr:MAG: hypothetical protein A2Y64_05860 [Candidatus Coatesbacteria bacterium RBG_13_66_14]
MGRLSVLLFSAAAILLAGCEPAEPLPNPMADIEITGYASDLVYPDGSIVPYEDRVVIVHGTVTDTDPLNSPDTWDGYVEIVRNKSESYVLSDPEMQQVTDDEGGGTARWEFFRRVRLFNSWNTLEIYVRAFPGGTVLEYSPVVSLSGNWSAGRDPVMCSVEWPGSDLANLNLHLLDDLGNDCSEDDPNIGGMILDVPDSYGYGPEYITATETRRATYRILVEYANDNGLDSPVNCKVHVYVRGAEQPQSPYRHTFQPDDVGGDPWEVTEVSYYP